MDVRLRPGDYLATEERLASEISRSLGDGPFTAKELAARLVSLDDPSALIGAFDEALSRAAAAAETDELDDALWGPPPTADELTATRRDALVAHQDALRSVLANSLTRKETAELLGVTPQAVSKRHAAGALVAISRGREHRFPEWQFHDGGTLPGLADVIHAYPGGALALSSWAVAPNPDLNHVSPAAALTRPGGVQRVLETVQALTADAW